MKTVVVGMSGGVDSSVAAYLLKEQGYQVVGLFMRNWDSEINNDVLGHKQVGGDICPQEEDYNDALQVCEQLDIPLHRIDFVKEYWDYVFKYFLEELQAGRTPNPDVMCNKFIKFDLFKKAAIGLGTDLIATGHYAIIENNKLYKAQDLTKDQSYFLAMLTTEQLSNVLMPLGNITKEEVRNIAGKLKLATASKKDSTGICFIGERHFNEFLSNYLPNQPGKIKLTETNEVIGDHNGLMYYTIGQRKGIHTKLNQPLFVYKKDLNENVLYVTGNEELLISNALLMDQVIFRNTEAESNSLTAKFRYRQDDIKVNVKLLDDNQAIVYYDASKAVATGQIAVFYNHDDECVGAGIIKEVYTVNGDELSRIDT